MFDELHAQAGPAAECGGHGHAGDGAAETVGGGAAREAARDCMLCPRAMTCASFLSRTVAAPSRREAAPSVPSRAADRRCA